MVSVLSILKCPECNETLQAKEAGLVCANHHSFPLSSGFINMIGNASTNVSETEKAATTRWATTNRLEEDKGYQEHQINDFLERYGFTSLQEFEAFLHGADYILEVGAGEGRLVDWLLQYSSAHIVALELSDSVRYLAEKYQEETRVTVVKADIGKSPFQDKVFDVVLMDQCIHFTTEPEHNFQSAIATLRPGGKAFLSVFARKSDIREQFDTIIRDKVSTLDDDKKLQFATRMTEIGKTLSDMDVEVDIPKEFTDFGHLAGRSMPLQRFLYYSVMKCFWNDNFTFIKNREFNYDWYCYPILKTSTLKEVKEWFVSAGLRVLHTDSNDSNVNVRGERT